MKQRYIVLILLAVVGVVDSGYLTIEHFQNTIPPCSVNPLFGDCGKVLQSEYSVIAGIPLALIGLLHYSFFTLVLIVSLLKKNKVAGVLANVLSFIGIISSLYFVYLQLIVIKSICLFCMVSAIDSLILFIIVQWELGYARKKIINSVTSLLYKKLLKPIFFLVDAEFIHTQMTRTGQLLGTSSLLRKCISLFFQFRSYKLRQQFHGISFENPIGLAAGFDYEARLTQILPSVGFGFQTLGTITYSAYEGNTKPLLGRLPKSKSLMVNKGYKNLGAKKTITSLSNLSFGIPVGVSIGRTNSKKLMSLRESIEDICKAFRLFEQSNIPHAYYELNISCPNLYGDVTFYPKKNLEELLTEVDALQIMKPIFIKMPIEKNDNDTIMMLDVIAKHCPKGVIFGNLQKNRSDPTLDAEEVAKFPVGNFSGKPTFIRSNELIRLTYARYHKRFTIIGCGGVFTPEDAYEKIVLGASLVQLITGMIYMGPQLISEINMGLVELLERDGYAHISEAIGVCNKN